MTPMPKKALITGIPAEVETLLGDPSHARERLGWVPEISVQQMAVTQW